MEDISDTISKIQTNKNKRYFVTLGAFLIQLSLGSFYSFVNIENLVVDYMKNNSYSGDSITLNKSPWIYSIMVFGMGASFSFGGYIDNLIGSSSTVLIGGWLVSFNICLMFVTLKTYFAIVVISYGLLAGFGMGIAYGVSLAAPVKYFLKNKGLIFGITLSGFGISATIFDAIQKRFLIDNNHKKIANDLPISFLILGIIYAIIQAIGSLLIYLSENNEAERKSISTISSLNWIMTNEPKISIDLEPHKIILELDFWILWILMFLNSFWIYFFSPMYKRYENHLNNSDKNVYEYLQRISLISALFNCGGRIFWGVLTDKMSFKKVMLIITLSSCVLYGSLSICLHYLQSQMIHIFATFLILINFMNSGNSLFFPTICAKLFGMKNFVCNFGMLFTSFSTSAVFSTILGNVINPADSKNPNTFEQMCSIASAVSFLAALITLTYRGRSLMFYQS